MVPGETGMIGGDDGDTVPLSRPLDNLMLYMYMCTRYARIRTRVSGRASPSSPPRGSSQRVHGCDGDDVVRASGVGVVMPGASVALASRPETLVS